VSYQLNTCRIQHDYELSAGSAGYVARRRIARIRSIAKLTAQSHSYSSYRDTKLYQSRRPCRYRQWIHSMACSARRRGTFVVHELGLSGWIGTTALPTKNKVWLVDPPTRHESGFNHTSLHLHASYSNRAANNNTQRQTYTTIQRRRKTESSSMSLTRFVQWQVPEHCLQKMRTEG